MTPLHLLVALPAEARPIRHRFGLVRDNRPHPYPLYRRDEIRLVICGVGRDNAAGACHWLRGRAPARPTDAWINIGIAGHPEAGVGSPFLASSVRDGMEGRELSTAAPHLDGIGLAPLISLPEARFDYPREALLDMEGYAFFSTARRFTPPRRVACMKIVSDNIRNPATRINGRMVSELISDNLPHLDHLIDTLEGTAP
ncbi:MAG: hypothetical protein G8D28_01230 [gamma proteobacterium symbiont of Phacoides pectinatus]